MKKLLEYSSPQIAIIVPELICLLCAPAQDTQLEVILSKAKGNFQHFKPYEATKVHNSF